MPRHILLAISDIYSTASRKREMLRQGAFIILIHLFQPKATVNCRKLDLINTKIIILRQLMADLLASCLSICDFQCVPSVLSAPLITIMIPSEFITLA